MVGGLSYGDVVKGSKRADAKRFVVEPLSGDMQFQCSSLEIGRITGLERDLLRAISVNSDRFNIYQDSDLLPYAQGLKEGSRVKVRHRNDSVSPYEEVAALVQYIGPLSETKMGTQFGLELMDDAYRGQGTSDGIYGKCRYFQTDPDCAVFVPISKLVPPSTSQGASYLYENVPRSKQELPNQPSELTSVGDIKKGTTVYLQVGNSMRRGRVVYMIVPHKETEPYATVEMPKKDGDRMWNGMHRGYHVFTPRNEVFTKFVPANNLTTLAPEEYQDLYTKEPSPSLPSKAKNNGKKPSEPFWAAKNMPRKTPSPYGSSEKLDKGSHKPSGGRRDVSDSYNPESFFVANNKPRKTPSPYGSSEKLDKGSHKPSGGRRDVSDRYFQEYQDLYTKEPSPSLPSTVKNKGKKPSEPFWAAKNKPRKTPSPYGSSEKLDKGSHKPSGGRRDVSESYNPESFFVANNKPRKTPSLYGSSEKLDKGSHNPSGGKRDVSDRYYQESFFVANNKPRKTPSLYGSSEKLDKGSHNPSGGKRDVSDRYYQESFFVANNKPRKTPSPYGSSEKLDKGSHKPSGGRRDVSDSSKPEYQDLYTKEPSPSLPSTAKNKGKKPSEPFWAAKNKPRKTPSPYGSSEKLDKGSHKPSGGRRDVSESYNPESFFVANNKPRKTPSLYGSSEKLDKGSHNPSGGKRDVSDRYYQEYQDLYTKEPSPSLPSTAKNKGKKPSEPFWAAKNKPRKTPSPYGSSEKLDKGSHKPSGGRRDVSESYNPESFFVANNKPRKTPSLYGSSEKLDKGSHNPSGGKRDVSDRYYQESFFVANNKPRKTPSPYGSSEKLDKGSHKPSGGRRDVSDSSKPEYQDLYTKEPSPSLPSTAKNKGKKPSEPFWAAKNKPRKTPSPYGSSEKLDKGSHKPSGGRRDVSDSYNPESFFGSSEKLGKGSHKPSGGRRDVSDSYNPDFLEEDVVEEVVKTICKDWRTVGFSLYLRREEMDRIAADCETEKERTAEMLRAWQRKGTGYDNISRLADACRRCNFSELANKLDQGLDETLLCKIASDIPPEKARVFGMFLNFSDEEMDLFEVETPHPLPRLRFMLAKWRTRQSHNSDKIMLLSNALQSCGLRQLALEVARGLDDDIMLSFAVHIGHNWKILATTLHLDVNVIKQLADFSEDKQPYQMLMLWRRRQDRSVDVLGALAKGLRDSGLPDLAYDLVQGVTDEMLGKLAVMIGDKWEAVAQFLGFNEEELKELKSDRNAETVTITNMLTKWRERHDYTRDRFGFLMEALRACGLGNIAESFEEDRRRLEQSKKVAPSAKTEEHPGYAKDKDRLERNLDREILVKVSQHVNFRELCRVIDFPTEDAIYIKKSYRRNEQRVFQVLDSWKRRGEGGNRSMSELLQVLAQLGCKPAVIDEIMRKDAADDKEEVNPMKQHPAEYTTIIFPSLTDEPQDEPCNPDLEVNSMVEVKPSDKTLFGVIRWIGVLVGSKSNKPVAGIELESSIDHGATDGTFNKQHYFQCEPNKAIFVYLSKCRPDSRVLSQAQTLSSTKRQTSQDFGGFASPLVEGFIDPPLRLRPEFVGMWKGIQGDQNSCYLDCTLFSMFAYNGVFDPLLRHTQGQGDLQEYEKVQKTLRESIANPLRKNGFVRADRILQLREHLDQLGTTKSLMSEKKDPEEFLHTLLSEVFKSRTLLKIRHGANKEVDESNIYQIFLDKDESFTLPTVEQLLLQSFQEHDLKLVETPSCLIVQMPRCDKDYKMYNRILPSLQLDVTNIIEEYPRQCIVCGNLAVFECSECKSEEALVDTTHIKNYCDSCFNMMHIGTHREHHQPTLLTIPDYFLKEFLSKTKEKGFSEEEVDQHRQRLLPYKMMDLFAVICIRTSRYVAFVKAGREKDSEWVFFDSMADRQGDQQGYYIPQITHLKDFWKWVDVGHIKARIKAKQLTEIMERLLGDAYICMYSDSEQYHQT
ncbi:uncharacterized protein LOC119737423 isoform X6 [Patiria miniata]|uniref:ubiquitinyl hydrolase 1 n=1 Tax=Patiria miniata TaxID=46514 RepID=A0A914AWR2_PATMI|nr:uncharacterized protein LOC119737423 isoform X6 [Patiria miniata]